jgi:hypothetical protein
MSASQQQEIMQNPSRSTITVGLNFNSNNSCPATAVLIAVSALWIEQTVWSWRGSLNNYKL